MRSIWGNLWQDVNSTSLRWLCNYDTDGSGSSHCSSLRPSLLPSSSFPQTICIYGFSKFLGSLINFWIHTQSCIHCPLKGILLGLPGLLKSVCKPSWPHMSCILHVPKASARSMMPESAISWNGTQAFFSFVCRGQVSWSLSPLNLIPRNKFSRLLPFWSMVVWGNSCQASFPNLPRRLQRMESCLLHVMLSVRLVFFLVTY